MDGDPQKSMASLLGEAVGHMSNMAQGEMALARAEVAENAALGGRALALLVLGALFGLTALLTLVAALVIGLIGWAAPYGIGPGWVTLGVGVALAVPAGLLAWAGVQRLSRVSLYPEKAIRGLGRDAELLKETLKNG
jgi:uncharacterized membrane protein YqjE